MKGKQKILLLFLFSFFLLFVLEMETAVATSRLENVLINIRDKLITVAYVVTILFMVIGGYQMIASLGNPENFERGKTTLLYATIGFIVISIAKTIVNWLTKLVSPQ